MASAQDADWPAIRRDFETGQFTLRELQAKHGVPFKTIDRHAKKEAWTKDLSAKIQKATRAAVALDAISGTAQNLLAALQAPAAPKPARPAAPIPPRPEDPASDELVVAAAAALNKEVILRHRQDMRETRDLALGMMGELQNAANAREELQALVDKAMELADGKIDAGKVRTAIGRICSLHQRVITLYRLAEVLARLQPLERRAYNIEDDRGGAGDFEEMLQRVHADIEAAEQAGEIPQERDL